ncbi:hypothetical protein D3C73_1208950 [compost metagenome]
MPGEVAALHHQRIRCLTVGGLDLHGSGRCLVQSRKRAEQGGLSAAIRTHQRNDTTRLKAKSCSMDHILVPITEDQVSSLEPGEFTQFNHKMKD